MRVLEITLEDGSIWHANLEELSKKRANYYACEVDGYDRFSTEWEEEFNYGMHDIGKSDLIDFVVNNMNWEELNAYKVKDPIQKPAKDMWSEADVDIKEV